jgi:hypothetical protein
MTELTSVMVSRYKGLLEAGHLSPYTGFDMEQRRGHGDVPLYCVLLKAGTVCKNRDKTYNLYCPC